MSMSSQTYPSNSSSPTSTSSPSDPSDPSAAYGGILGNLLTANGSPPLIVAFLAIGLFAVSVIGFLGWRRSSRRRRLVLQPAPTIRHKSVALGKKPILWDLWAGVPGLGNVGVNNIEEIRCENIAPFAAVVTFLSTPEDQPEKPSPPLRSTASRHRYHHILLQLLALAVRRLHLSVFPEPPPPPAPPPGPEDTVSGEEDSETESRSSDVELEWEGPSSLGVSIVIAMPTQRTSSGQTPTSEGGVDLEREEMGEYCIGTMEVPWSEGE